MLPSLPARCLAGLLLSGVVLTGCSSTSSPSSAPSTSEPGDATSAPAVETEPALAVDVPGGATCSPRSRRGRVASFWGSTAVARQDLVVTDVQPVGQGVRLLGVDGVVTVMPADDRSGLSDDRWPIGNRYLPAGTDTAGRRALSGTSFAAGQQVLPIVGLRITGDPAVATPTLSSLAVSWTAADGTSGTTDVPYDQSFPAGAC